MKNLKTIITNEKVKGTIAIAAAVVMLFTPDHVDAVIEILLSIFGIKKFIITKKSE